MYLGEYGLGGMLMIDINVFIWIVFLIRILVVLNLGIVRGLLLVEMIILIIFFLIRMLLIRLFVILVLVVVL